MDIDDSEFIGLIQTHVSEPTNYVPSIEDDILHNVLTKHDECALDNTKTLVTRIKKYGHFPYFNKRNKQEWCDTKMLYAIKYKVLSMNFNSRVNYQLIDYYLTEELGEDWIAFKTIDNRKRNATDDVIVLTNSRKRSKK